MLIRFRVENYRSFSDERELSMLAGASRDHAEHVTDIGGRSLLHLSALFGANGSGKSNFIDAVAASRRMVLANRFPEPFEYCRTAPDGAGRPTSFGYTVLIDGAWYDYGFEADLRSRRIESEWLRDLSHAGGPLDIFVRSGNDVVTGIPDLTEEESKFFFVYSEEALNDGKLFLGTISKMRVSEGSAIAAPSKVFAWFRDSLRIIPLPYRRTALDRLLSPSSKRLLPGYGTGVTDVGVEETDIKDAGLPDSLIDKLIHDPVLSNNGYVAIGNQMYSVSFDDGDPKLLSNVFFHNGTSFRYSEESDGTKRLMDLLELMDPETGTDTTYIVDELEARLHPQLTRKLVSDFLDAAPGMGRQLILTIHESRLLDLGLLRRDEIWFVDKDEHGTSDLYSLEEFSERKDRRIDKAYLEGRYGAVPLFDVVFPDLDLTWSRQNPSSRSGGPAAEGRRGGRSSSCAKGSVRRSAISRLSGTATTAPGRRPCSASRCLSGTSPCQGSATPRSWSRSLRTTSA